MLILLPPSETKTGAHTGKPVDLAAVSAPELTDARAAVGSALAAVSARPDAAKVLKVSANLTAEIARNTVLDSSPATAAAKLYTGVLFDALDLPSLDTASRRRANRSVRIVSALYGVLRLTDKVAPYRLSMGVNLPGIGPLAGFWKPLLTSVLPTDELVVDCRSSTYAAAWTPPAERWLQVSVPGATHMAKRTRGEVTRILCEHSGRISRPEQVLQVLHDAGRQAHLEPAGPRGQVLSVPWI